MLLAETSEKCAEYDGTARQNFRSIFSNGLI